MKVALLEVSHWHVPLYLNALETSGVQVVAVSDSEHVKGKAIAERFKCPLYSSSYELLEREEVDFAFVFGRHSQMPSLAQAVIARNIPFALEKPCGINMAQVTRLRELAEQANLYCAVPLIFRMSELLSALQDAQGGFADFNYMSFRFIVGPPARYETAGSGWAIDPVFSGGGSTINVATHFIDLFRLLTGKEVARVSAVMNSLTHRGAVEDYSLLTLQTEDGVIGVVETGYSFPSTADEQREFSFTLSSNQMYAKSGPDRIEIRDRENLAAGTRSRRLQLDTDVYYPLFVKQVLADCCNGAKPIASLRDAEAIMQVMDAAYASARQGGTLLTLTSDE
ncbi:Inositol 2-dehydrogenase/D-chiro-inositol 3-dehydrogenase [Pseudomonas extremaustralis]|uniref:Inositol 2-dehydrogenase/D-chiro-inositol 3-dehydrogenase n=1 Tax=Pseudomonas extremaustralis TaxID=359110 RepID=A0A5M9J4L7_9PSED|nr:Gfo/Idh/MocA family oxidoreductase [Pseudomonas extremaustralis]KAA8562725.1 Inositol 2-dehydrogenase/D-chiro-inositol 3-dehydrogenase [Pseudomonas extremaustralis]